LSDASAWLALVPLPQSLNQFKDGICALGYAQGHDHRLHVRYAEAKLDKLPPLAAKLVRLKMDVIVARWALDQRVHRLLLKWSLPVRTIATQRQLWCEDTCLIR
jgi:hypothetical protein